MDPITPADPVNRRRILGIAAAGVAAAELIKGAAAQAQAAAPPAPGDASFAPLKQVNAGLLNVGYAEAGPADGPPVILLHGWPYDIHSFVEVAPHPGAPRATASSCPTCAATARRASSPPTPCATASRRWSRSTSSR